MQTITGSAGIPSHVAFGATGAADPANTVQGIDGIPSSLAFGADGKLVTASAAIAGIPSSLRFGVGGIVRFSGATQLKFQIFVAGSEIVAAGFVSANSIRVVKQLGARSTATFEIQDRGNAYRPEVGDSIVILKDGAKVFSGTVEETDERSDNGPTVAINNLRIAVSCTDWGILCDRRIIGEVYPGASYGTLNSIVQDIADKYLAPEGIAFVPGTDPGIELGDMIFNWVSISDAFSQLSQATGLDWKIDYDRNLTFYDASVGAAPAPFDLTNSSANWRTMTVKRTRGKYRNVQYIRTSSPAVQQVPAYIQLDPLESGTILGYTFTNIGGGGSPANDWLAAYGDKSSILALQSAYAATGLSTASSWTSIGGGAADAPGAIWELKVKPVPMVHIDISSNNPLPELSPVVLSQRDGQIAAQAAISGGTGRIEEIEAAPDVVDEDTAQALAEGLLVRYSDTGIPIQVSFGTDLDGLEPGQTITINTSWPLVADLDLVIFSVSATEIAQAIFRYDVVCNNGPSLGNWQTLWAKVIALAKNIPNNTPTESCQFVLAKTINGIANPGITTGVNVTGVRALVRTRGVLAYVSIQFNTALTADLEVDIIARDPSGAEASILADPIVYPKGATDLRKYSAFRTNPTSLAAGTLLSVTILAGAGGADGMVVVAKYA